MIEDTMLTEIMIFLFIKKFGSIIFSYVCCHQMKFTIYFIIPKRRVMKTGFKS